VILSILRLDRYAEPVGAFGGQVLRMSLDELNTRIQPTTSRKAGD
jgi:hypothetical protein